MAGQSKAPSLGMQTFGLSHDSKKAAKATRSNSLPLPVKKSVVVERSRALSLLGPNSASNPNQRLFPAAFTNRPGTARERKAVRVVSTTGPIFNSGPHSIQSGHSYTTRKRATLHDRPRRLRLADQYLVSAEPHTHKQIYTIP